MPKEASGASPWCGASQHSENIWEHWESFWHHCGPPKTPSMQGFSHLVPWCLGSHLFYPAIAIKILYILIGGSFHITTMILGVFYLDIWILILWLSLNKKYRLERAKSDVRYSPNEKLSYVRSYDHEMDVANLDSWIHSPAKDLPKGFQY